MTALLEARVVALPDRLEPTDLQAHAGELVAVIGPNGGGKTSLLRALAGIETSGGSVRISGHDVRLLGPSLLPQFVTFMPASRGLVWPIPVRDVIALGLPRTDSNRIDELIELLELGSLAARPADRLSTGERARVLFARALAPKPRLLLLDEPLSNLDPYWVLRLLEILRETTSAGTTALVTLHDIDRTDAFDRALLISKGRIRADLSSAEMLQSAALTDAFRIERASSGWALRRSADPRSSR
jgi:ABC-type cobalamin/Fe3+-siderophores transport systems, ATPase components